MSPAALAKANYRMTCEDFFFHAEDEMNQLIDELYWEGGVDTEAMFQEMRRLASISGIDLTDVERWDYDRFLYQTYKDAEKGLS